MLLIPIIIFAVLILLGLGINFIAWQKQSQTTNQISNQTTQLNQLLARLDERERFNAELRASLERLLKEQRLEQTELRAKFDEHQLQNLKSIIDSLQKGMLEIRSQISEVLKNNSQVLDERLHKLTGDTNNRLKEINERVEQRLNEGFAKTTATFTDVVKRLALIDEAQKKIAELSGSVISLQEILADKRSRGVFGEIQLADLIRNVLPEKHFAFQYTLSNHKRADCILFLPEPTGNIIIDAKFPLESFQRLADFNLPESERNLAKQTFHHDIRKHILDIAEKYIISGETADCALMFIPAEAIFAEIHAYYADLITFSHQKKVWLVSPSTMMALLTTVRAVLKDAATQQQAHLIKEHLAYLSKDFLRFQERMDALARHVNQAHTDVEEVYRSSKKISSRFTKIEKAELGDTGLLEINVAAKREQKN